LDEPLEGLAPIMVEERSAAIGRMIAQEGTAVILTEQHAEVVLSLTQDAVVMERGVIVHRAPSQELLNDAATLDRLIGLRIEGGQQQGTGAWPAFSPPMLAPCRGRPSSSRWCVRNCAAKPSTRRPTQSA